MAFTAFFHRNYESALAPLVLNRGLVASIVFLCCASPAFSESLTIAGMPFQVEHFREIDPQTVKVTLHGHDLVLSRTTYEERIVQDAFSSTPPVAPADIERFTNNAITQGKLNLAKIGLIALIAVNETAAERTARLFPRDAAGNAALQEVLKNNLSSNGTALVIFELIQRDPTWVRVNALPQVLEAYQPLTQRMRMALLNSFRERAFGESERILNLQRDLFSDRDKAYQDGLLMSRQVRDGLTAAERGSFDELTPLLVRFRSEPDFAAAVSPLVTSVLHQRAMGALAAGDVSPAFYILSKVPIAHRTPTTHDLFIQALRKVSPSLQTPLRDTELQQSLISLSKFDVEIQALTADRIEAQVRYQARARRFDGVDPLLQFLEAVRPDPNQKNDALRLDYALALFDDGREIAARAIVADIQTPLSVSSKARLWMRGHFGDVLGTVSFALIPIFTTLLLLARNRARKFAQRLASRPSESRARVESEQFEEAEEDLPPPLFGAGRASSLRVSPGSAEYRDCLAQLLVAEDADAKAIKSSYRNLIKEVHPDLNPHSTPEQQERFVTLTRIYERALELRKELGLDA